MAKHKLTLLLLISLLAAGCSFFASPGKDKDKPQPPETVTVTVYRPSQDGDLLYPEKYELTKKAGGTTPELALNALLTEQPRDKEHINIFPPKVKLLSLKMDGSLAQADFSKEILTGERGGSLREMLLVSSIVNTLTEFTEITSVQLLVDGQKIDTIGGHMDVLDPLKRNESLIKK